MIPTLKVIGSSSKGNGYILETDDDILLIELGLPFIDYLRAMNYSEGLKKVRGALVTHSHKDHSGHIQSAFNHGVKVYSTEDVVNTYPFVNILDSSSSMRFGSFTVQAYKVPHSVECYSFVIKHKDFGKMLFATDCSRFPYLIRGLNHIFIECNYSEDILFDRMCDGGTISSQYENHLSYDRCETSLKRLYNEDLQTIVLLHLSDANSDEQRYRGSLKQMFPCVPTIDVADRGKSYELLKSEF